MDKMEIKYITLYVKRPTQTKWILCIDFRPVMHTIIYFIAVAFKINVAAELFNYLEADRTMSLVIGGYQHCVSVKCIQLI